MDQKGKLRDILIIKLDSHAITIAVEPRQLIIWTEEKCEEIIKSIEGVLDVSTPFFKNQYYVKIDPRYELEFISEKIEFEISIFLVTRSEEN